MWVIRPARLADLNALVDLAESLGPGMTTLPADRKTLAHKLDATVASFSGQVSGAAAQYLLVLEDNDVPGLMGVSAVYPKIGHPFGFFSYHIDRLVQHSSQIAFNLDCKILNLSNAYTGMTEIGTLAVRPTLRKTGAGRMLARARYLLMACFPDLFANTVIAEMRGWQDSAGENPFWSAVGRRFFHMPFAEADRVSAVKGAEWIASLMPKFPIYLDLLSAEAQACIGKPHDTSAIAMKMLLEEGFRFENYVDVFDAGPQLIAPVNQIKTVTESNIFAFAADLNDGNHTDNWLITNTSLEKFRVLSAPASVQEGKLNLDPVICKLLDCDFGSHVRAVSNAEQNLDRTLKGV
jgi:arginine N-succinyltransferase